MMMLLSQLLINHWCSLCVHGIYSDMLGHIFLRFSCFFIIIYKIESIQIIISASYDHFLSYNLQPLKIKKIKSKSADLIILDFLLTLICRQVHDIIIQKIQIGRSIDSGIKMQENIQDYDDIFAGLNQQILKNLYIRFYTMEEYFQFTLTQDHLAAISTQDQVNNATVPETKKVIPVTLVYNRIVQECIFDIYILNKLILSKAKTVNSILDNGRNIANKKSQIWKQFINEPGFEKVKSAYKLMKNAKRNIIKYSVLSISNLLLKLGINMSKVSIFPIQRFLNFECLNIPTLSVAFLQYMQYKLYQTKNITDQNLQINFIKQLPKITFIKFGKYKNNTDIQILQTSQDAFISKQTKQFHKNLQFIDIHERSEDPIRPTFQRKTSYPYFYSIDLEKLANGVLKSPYTFQILEIMRQLVFPVVKDFKPDLVVYMESFPNSQIVMDDEIRGLMISEMAEETTCNKMYVMKQFGPEKYAFSQYRNLINKFEQKQMSEQNTKNGQTISQQFSKIFDQEQKSFAYRYTNKLLTQQQKNSLQKAKKIFINEVCYIGLALIQKTSFDNVLQKSHKHFHHEELLQGMYNQLQCRIQKIDKSEQSLMNALKFKKQGVKMMLQVLKFRSYKSKNNQNGLKIINLINKQTQFKQFYNIFKKQNQLLQAFQENTSKIHIFSFTEQDNFIVKYYEQDKRLLAIIIKNAVFIKENNQKMMEEAGPNQETNNFVKVIILSKRYQDKSKYMRLEKILQLPAQKNYILDPIYVCSHDFLYRAFGKFKFNNKMGDSRQGFNTAIHRLQINPLIGEDWQLVATEGVPVRSDGKQQKKIQIQRKVHGYGIHDADNKGIALMGGYIDSANEQKISKNIYIVRTPDIATGKQLPKVYILGKTNKIVYNTPTQKIKDIFIYPFVFGIPFYLNLGQGQKSIASVLNSNGYYLNLNLTNKIFLSLIKLSAINTYNGINVQNKLRLEEKCQQAATSIFISEIVNKCLVCYPHQINMKGPVCCVQTLDQGNIIMQADPVTKQIYVIAKQVFEDQQTRKIGFI